MSMQLLIGVQLRRFGQLATGTGISPIEGLAKVPQGSCLYCSAKSSSTQGAGRFRLGATDQIRTRPACKAAPTARRISPPPQEVGVHEYALFLFANRQIPELAIYDVRPTTRFFKRRNHAKRGVWKNSRDHRRGDGRFRADLWECFAFPLHSGNRTQPRKAPKRPERSTSQPSGQDGQAR